MSGLNLVKSEPDTRVTTMDPRETSSLQILSFSHCGELNSLFPTLLMQGGLTCLLNIELHGCNNITSFPSEEACGVCGRLTSLRWLTLIKCGELTSIEGLKALPHLHVLTIYDCPKLVQAAAAATSASIKWTEEEFTLTVDKLDIHDPLLLHIEPLRKLTSLRQVHITDCSHLEGAHTESWLLQNTASLQCLYLNNIAKSLPCCLQNLSSLKYLELTEAYELQSLPQLPSSLQKLKIWNCNGTLKEQYRENKGSDWPNIQHIRYIRISL